MMSTFLISVAELSNIFSVLATLVCFFGMVFLIMKNIMLFRVYEDFMFGGALHHTQPRITKMKMMKITIPFILKLDEKSKSTDFINCSLTSQTTCTIRVFWGVSIRELHMFLWKPWSVIQKSAESGEMLSGFYQLKGMEEQYGLHLKEKPLMLKVPEPALDLGTPPRLCYPLVIVIMRNESMVHPDETVALVNVIHIKDSVCTLPTSILAQYLKQGNGQLSCLKQLYLAAGNNVCTDDTANICDKEDMSVWAMAGEQLCVVCQYYPLSRVLLPCRHTCVCCVCFEKLDRCPMCRSPFSSYFTIRTEDYTNLETTTADMKPTRNNWINNWNDRIINFLGYH